MTYFTLYRDRGFVKNKLQHIVKNIVAVTKSKHKLILKNITLYFSRVCWYTGIQVKLGSPEKLHVSVVIKKS